MRKLLMVAMILVFLILSGCGSQFIRSDDSLPPAAKHLLMLRQGIISVATSADTLCTLKRLNQDQCNQVAEIYQKAMVSYDTVADALNVALKMENSMSAWEKYTTFHNEFIQLYSDILKLAVSFGMEVENE